MGRFLGVFLAVAVICGVVSAEDAVVIDSSWDHTIGIYGQMALYILGPVVLLLVSLVCIKLKGKLGAEVAAITEQLLTAGVKKAINYADAWAAKQATKPAGTQKLQVALDFLYEILKKYNIADIAKEKLIELIEGQLKYDKQTTDA